MINFKSFCFVFILIMAGFFTSCQTGSVEETHSTKATITKSTPLSTYIERVAMQKTSQDNVIDHSNCFTIKLPYVVTVNNIQISINSSNDYQLVQNNINAYSNDNDIVTIHFPITVILYDYSEKSIANQTDYNSFIALCQNNLEVFGKINCININYPIVINVYDSNNQMANTISINNNQSLYNFFNNLESNKFLAINYPISITDTNGSNVTITDNSQFENSIKEALDKCSENTNSTFDFIKIITNNSWKISYYFNNYEKTSSYDGYSFTFNSNYKVVATKSGISKEGTWSTKVDNGVREFEIKFDLDPLKHLNEGWKVFEFNTSQLRFKKDDGNNESDYLYFEKLN